MICIEKHNVLLIFGEYTLYLRGIFFALAFLSSLILILYQSHKKHDWLKIGFLYLAVIAGIFVGTKLFFLIFNLSKFCYLVRQNPLSYGTSSYGGIVGAVTFGYIFLKYSNLNFWEVSDYFAVPAIFSIVLGRISCFLIGCCAGIETSLPWGVIYNGSSKPVHPAQLYEAVMVLGILFYILKKRKRRYISGELFLTFLVLYSIVRIILDFIRINPFLYELLPYLQLAIGLLIFIIRKKSLDSPMPLQKSEPLT